jgi:DNA-binding XRE family transcriptional regulator
VAETVFCPTCQTTHHKRYCPSVEAENIAAENIERYEIVRRRRGAGETLASIAKDLGISPERVRQIENNKNYEIYARP